MRRYHTELFEGVRHESALYVCWLFSLQFWYKQPIPEGCISLGLRSHGLWPVGSWIMWSAWVLRLFDKIKVRVYFSNKAAVLVHSETFCSMSQFIEVNKNIALLLKTQRWTEVWYWSLTGERRRCVLYLYEVNIVLNLSSYRREGAELLLCFWAIGLKSSSSSSLSALLNIL